MRKGLVLYTCLLLLPSNKLIAKEYMTVCIDYHCERKQSVELGSNERKSISLLFINTAHTAEQERALIANAIGRIEQLVGQYTPNHVDQRENEGEDEPGQLDCIAESSNTTRYLHMLNQMGLIKFHSIMPIVERGNFLLDVHRAASIKDNSNNQRFVVDSWFRKNGEPAVIQDLDHWMRKKPFN